MLYLYLKSLHIIFVVCWFSGLFYIVRLFVYYCEAEQQNKVAQNILQDQYRIMITRLWNIITWPAAILTTLFGISMLVSNPTLLSMGWMHVKLAFIVLLFIYQIKCNQYVSQIKNNSLKKKASYFRIYNEGATLILFSVIFIVILKNSISWIFGVVGLVGLALLLMMGIKFYKSILNNKSNPPR